MAVIGYLSGDQFSDDQTAAWLSSVPFMARLGLPPAAIDTANLILRKSTHFVEYAMLALLAYRAFGLGEPARRRWSRALGALLIAVVYATVDELRQAMSATRSGTAHDALIDTLGAAVALLGAIALGRRREPPSA
ncbi:MAG: VanZ family protein [Candidatus Binatia bacterium]